ncbi:MAG: pyridoxamine 5'-phosphate oxidase family protein [Gammaproteobacteria bacterium]|jgi:hypothetical protein|nr:pyridoxamine 5'-phosphate oxidase family protein [Gammaproteobacteria bacterium]MCH1550554.1 hypothetical protein [Pseudomonadales bacterium]
MELERDKHYGQWTGAQIMGFLAETLIPVRLGLTTKNGPLIVPVWFEYSSHRLHLCSPDNSLLVDALRANPEVSFDVSTNDLPYAGIRGRGIASCTVAHDNRVLEKLITRYVGHTDNALADMLLNRASDEALVEIEPTWITSWDFSGRMRGIESVRARVPEAPM